MSKGLRATAAVISNDIESEGASVPKQAAPVPLLIDLDRTLLRTDLLFETALAYVTTRPHRIFDLAVWLFKGRAHLKRKLAEAATLELDLMPVNADVVALAEKAKAEGRPVFLVTASDAVLAERVASRFPFFDGVVSSNGAVNLKGLRKAEAIRERFPGDFDYAGDCAADLHIWRDAREVIAVAPSRSTLRRIRTLGKPTTVFDGKPRMPALVRAMRLHQWAKNTLIFVPAILSGQIVDPTTFANCCFAFLALGLLAASTYLINDLFDLPHDRKHWSKSARPIASGDLTIGAAIAAALVTGALGLAIGAAIGMGVLLWLMAYLILTLAYSLKIKRLPILDVVALASLFTLRLAIGIEAADVYASPWLLVFSMFLFTSLSVAKRYTEIQRAVAKGDTEISGRGYIAIDGPLILALGIASATGAVLILVLYLIFDAFSREFYQNSVWLWFFPVIIFLWLSRVWLVSQRGELNDDPVAFALKDRQSLVLGAALTLAFVMAWLGLLA